MKGHQTVTLKGDEVGIAFTIGALEDLQDYLKDEGAETDLDKALSDMKHLRKMLEIMSEYAGKKVEAKEFKFMDFSEMNKVIEFIESATENVSVGKGEKAK